MPVDETVYAYTGLRTQAAVRPLLSGSYPGRNAELM
jgi:hypothetical protein